MKKIKKKTENRIKCFVLGLVILISIVFPQVVSAGSCGGGLARCAADAAIVGFFSGAGPGSAYLSGCVVGYSWCLRYYR